MKIEKNPFIDFEYKKETMTNRQQLTSEEIRRLETLELKKDSLMWHCRNYFLFSFYLAGIRAGDLIQLRWCNITSEERLQYIMDKTGNYKSLPLLEQAKNVLSHYIKENSKPTDYIFPLLDSQADYAKAATYEQKLTMTSDLKKKLLNTVGSKNALINKYLKKIAILAEIEKPVSFHIARHSFAKVAKEKKVDNNHLKALFGHSSLKITEKYMGRFDTEDTDKAMESIFK